MDFQSAMETFAEAWVAANTKGGGLADVGCSQSHAMALTRNCKTPSVTPPPPSHRGPNEASPMDRPPPPLTPHQEVTALSAPKEEFESSKTSPAKSLPVHCIVEAISSLNDTKLLWKKKPLIETDSYVIISSNTAFHDLVHVALQMLGYPRDVFSAAKGSILIKNWKPLSFESIADGPLVTVGDILGELTTVATLKIQLYRSRPNILSDIKEKLLRLLLAQSHSLLESTGCPLDEVTLSQMCRGQSLSPPLAEPSEECRRKFEQWWSTQVNQHHHSGAPHNRRPSPASRYSPHHRPSASPGKAPPPPPDTVHPALQTVQSQYPTQKTRMRTSFDPELELPKLQRWFAENQHPSRQQIQHYVKELNGLESRRGRKPLDVNNVVYWFKNARAAQKRAELRSIGPGMSCHLSLNGYSSNSHSPPNSGAGILIGQDSLMGESRLLQPTLKCSSPPTRSPTRGPLFLSNHHSDNSNDGGQMSDQDYEEDRLVDGRLEHRDFRDEIRGDPRDDIRNRTEMNDGRDTGSPVAPLSLTTNDKERTSNLSKQYKTVEDTNRKEDRGDPLRNDEKKGMMSARIEEVEALNITNRPLSLIMNDKDNTISTNQEDIHEIEGIKQEPPDDVASSLLTTNNNNLSNKQEAEDMSDIDEEDDDEDVEDIDERRKYNIETDEELGSIHSGRISDLSRPSDRLRAFRSPSPSDLIVSRGPPTGQPGLDRLTAAGFPLVPNSMFSHSIMYMSHYIPGLTHQHHGHHPSIGPSTAPSSSNAGLNLSALASSADERRKRNRTFIDPVTEVPRLEQWFSLNTHPSHNLILKYTEELNRMPYRQKFPRLEPKNVQFWFKNRRAKCKRLKMSLFETGPSGIQANLQPLPYHQQPPSEDSLRNRD